MTPARAPSPGAHREPTAYRFDAARVLVEITDPDAARWLAELLIPWLAADSATDDGPIVRMTASRDLFDELGGRLSSASVRQMPCFRLDRGLARCPGWHSAEGSIVAADAVYRCFYRVRPPAVEVIAAPGDYLSRVGLMRAVRELAIPCTAHEPAVVELHAAAFVHDGSAVLLAGGRRQGKTTLLAHALASGEAALMANDRVIVDVSSGMATGVPTFVAVRAGTERLFGALGRGLPRRAALLHADELSMPDAQAAASGSRLVLSPAQLARQLEARIQPCARLGAVVFPEICPDERTWSLQPLSPATGVHRLREATYARDADPSERSVLHFALEAPGAGSFAPSPSKIERRAALARLAATVPMIRLRVGPEAYAECASGLLHALTLATKGARA